MRSIRQVGPMQKECTPTYIYIYINKKQETLGIWPIKTTNGTKQELGRV